MYDNHYFDLQIELGRLKISKIHVLSIYETIQLSFATIFRGKIIHFFFSVITYTATFYSTIKVIESIIRGGLARQYPSLTAFESNFLGTHAR